MAVMVAVDSPLRGANVFVTLHNFLNTPSSKKTPMEGQNEVFNATAPI